MPTAQEIDQWIGAMPDLDNPPPNPKPKEEQLVEGQAHRPAVARR
jgi:hypothetical protein